MKPTRAEIEAARECIEYLDNALDAIWDVLENKPNVGKTRALLLRDEAKDKALAWCAEQEQKGE